MSNNLILISANSSPGSTSGKVVVKKSCWYILVVLGSEVHGSSSQTALPLRIGAEVELK